LFIHIRFTDIRELPGGNRLMATMQQTVEKPGGQTRVVLGLATVFLTYFVYSYFFQSLLSALPRITADLDGMPLYEWGVSIPSLGLAFSMLMIGKLSDLYGRRALLLACLSISVGGAIWCAFSANFIMFIIARTVLSIGQGGLAPLCFAALGDMFEPVQRSRWIGLLNIPAGIFAFVGPTLGGWFTDTLSWRYIFWCGIPLLLFASIMVLFGLSKKTQHTKPKIDARGATLAAVASSTLILAFSVAGTICPWASPQVIGLFCVSLIFWALFVKVEASAEEPILDMQVLKNRSFMTISLACLFSAFGMTGLMIYYPLLIQGVQGANATLTGKIMTPGNVLMNFLGVAAGFLVARTKRYRWMFVMGYGLTMLVMFALMFFQASTPISWGFAAITVAGFGMGVIPTLNTLVAQYAVPRRLLGVATGALFFVVMLGQAIAPAVMGSAMHNRYNSTLIGSLPQEVRQLADRATVTSLGDPSVLLSKPAMASLAKTLQSETPEGKKVLDRTVSAISISMEAGLRVVFLIGAIAMLLTFLTICVLPQISIDAEVKDKRAV
jgi:MFS family permease